MSSNPFGQTLKNLRTRAKLSQEELAYHLEVSRVTLIRTENGKNVPRADFVLKSYLYFQQEKLVTAYITVQRDKKERAALAAALYPHHVRLGLHVARRLIHDSLRSEDYISVITILFQMVMWDLRTKGRTVPRKLDWIVRAYEQMDTDPALFLTLLEELYSFCKESGDFEAFLRLTETMPTKIKLDPARYANLLYQKANAYYYSGNHFEAYRTSLRALDVAEGLFLPNACIMYQRHALICMQIGNFSEADEYAHLTLTTSATQADPKHLSKSTVARIFYMNKKFEQATEVWKDVFAGLARNDVRRIHSLNDVIMMNIEQKRYDEAETRIRECERLLSIAHKQKWAYAKIETLLLDRNRVLLSAMVGEECSESTISSILAALKESYLQDEYRLTADFVLHNIFLSDKMELSEKRRLGT